MVNLVGLQNLPFNFEYITHFILALGKLTPSELRNFSNITELLKKKKSRIQVKLFVDEQLLALTHN